MNNSGILPSQDLVRLINTGIIKITDFEAKSDDLIQPSSIDLVLGDKATILKSAFLPNKNESIEKTIKRFKRYDFSLSEKKSSIIGVEDIAIVPLQVSTNLPKGFYGKTNPKSTTGRSDTLTRIIADNNFIFDVITHGDNKQLYTIITPNSFDIKIKKNLSLGQLRINYGASRILTEKDLLIENATTPLLHDANDKPIDISNLIHKNAIKLSADLSSDIVAYRAKKSSLLEYDLAGKRGCMADKVDDFWDVIEGPIDSLVLEKGWFYLLATKEKTRFRPNICGDLIPTDVGAFEGRNHYAGFFDPGFGYGLNGEIPATTVTLEVRAHENFEIRDGQFIGLMSYEYMNSVPLNKENKVEVYGSGTFSSNYQAQPPGPTLGKQFLPNLPKKD